jgi:hypothetical protein
MANPRDAASGIAARPPLFNSGTAIRAAPMAQQISRNNRVPGIRKRSRFRIKICFPRQYKSLSADWQALGLSAIVSRGRPCAHPERRRQVKSS